MKWYFFLFCLMTSFVAWSQNDESSHFIYLKDSRYFAGKIIETDYGNFIKLHTPKNEIITIPTYHIQRIKKNTPNTIIFEKGNLATGMYIYTLKTTDGRSTSGKIVIE